MLSLPCTVYDRILLCLFLVFLTLFWAFLSFQIRPRGRGPPKPKIRQWVLTGCACYNNPSLVFPLSILQYLKGFLASTAKKSMAITEIQMEYFQTEWSSRP